MVTRKDFKGYFESIIPEFTLDLCEIGKQSGNFDYSGLSFIDIVQDTDAVNTAKHSEPQLEYENTYVTFADGTTKTVAQLTDEELAEMLYELAFGK